MLLSGEVSHINRSHSYYISFGYQCRSPPAQLKYKSQIIVHQTNSRHNGSYSAFSTPLTDCCTYISIQTLLCALNKMHKAHRSHHFKHITLMCDIITAIITFTYCRTLNIRNSGKRYVCIKRAVVT